MTSAFSASLAKSTCTPRVLKDGSEDGSSSCALLLATTPRIAATNRSSLPMMRAKSDSEFANAADTVCRFRGAI